MIISFTLNTKVLKLLDVTLQQLLLIDLLYRKTSVSRIKEFVKADMITDLDIQNLIDKDILTPDSTLKDINNIKFKHGFKANYERLGSDDSWFKELYDLYPSSAVRPDGKRSFLKTNSNQMQNMYNNIVGNDREMHEMIMKALQAEINYRMMTGDLGYMKTMRNWIQQESWLENTERQKHTSEQILPGYGESFA